METHPDTVGSRSVAGYILHERGNKSRVRVCLRGMRSLQGRCTDGLESGWRQARLRASRNVMSLLRPSSHRTSFTQRRLCRMVMRPTLLSSG